MNKIKLKEHMNHLFSFIKKYKLILALILLFAVGILVTVITSLSRVGFNMNVVYDQDKPEDAWFMKLTNNEAAPEVDYVTYSGSTSDSLSGNGTKESPYLITKPEDLDYLRNIAGTYEYRDTSTGELCENKFTYKEESVVKTVGYTPQNEPVYQAITEYQFRQGIDKKIVAMGIKFNSTTNTIYFVGMPISNYFTEEAVNSHIVQETGMIDITPQGAENGFREYYINNLNINTDGILDIRLVADRGEAISNVVFELYDEDNNIYTVDQNTNCVYQPVTKDKYFRVENNIDFGDREFAPIGTYEHPFDGIIDGNYKYFKNLKVDDRDWALGNHYVGMFGYIDDATVKNFYLVDSDIKTKGNVASFVGSLVGYAAGNSKIYNNGTLGNSKVKVDEDVVTPTYVGGLVGYISGTTVVTNSFNYASIESTTTSRNVKAAGVVGYRTGENTKLDDENPKVYLLVNYGEINVLHNDYQYVYNGVKFNASEAPTYCYYLWYGDTKDTNAAADNTYAILKSYDDIIADGFKANLNNYRFMVDYYVGNSTDKRANENDGYSDIAFWYTQNNVSLYPILKQKTNQSSNYNYDDVTTASRDNTVKVNLVNPSTNETKSYYVSITNKHENLNDYTNRKITLPFNSKSANFQYGSNGMRDGYRMTVSGWELKSVVQDGKTITNQVDGSKINYNYVLRTGENAAAKDINTIYAEGGFYLVPEGVTEITLNAHFAYTIYAKDKYYDMVYNTNYNNGDSSFYGDTGSDNSKDGRTPETAVSTLNEIYNKVGQMPGDKYNLYDVVVMLCGNLHYNPEQTVAAGAYVTTSNWAYFGNDRAFTMMSMDNDGDLEPDYAFYTRNVHDQDLPSIRFNFINVLGIPQVGTINAKLNAITLMNGAKFEVTETAKTDRIDLRHYQASYVKLNGGYYDVYSLWMAEAKQLTKKYIYFGGYAKAIYFTAGVESRAIPYIMQNDLPVFVVSGGRIDTLASTYFNTVVNASNDVYFYVDGGYVNNFYTTYNASLNKKAEVNINDSYVNTYYAGGHTESAYVRGGVTTNVVNSRIGDLYGGPEYGTILKGSTLNVENSVIDNFYGSGYGGTQTTEINLVYQDSGGELCSSPNYYYNIENTCSRNNSTDMGDANKTYCFGRESDEYGIETGFYSTTYSKAGCASKAFAVYYSSLSAANVDRVTVNIKGSTINNDFYGGGNKGIVDKSIVVNMEDTTVKGNLYGGGRSNAQETLEVYENTDGYEAPRFISYNVDTEAVYPQKYTYTWSGDESKFNGSTVNTDEKLIYSENDGKLGNVKGEIFLNIKNSTIEKDIYGGGNLSEVLGDIYINLDGTNNIAGKVYGGGNEADVTGNIDVRLNEQKLDNVYGGGNLGNVVGLSTITLNGGNIENIFGGGNEASVTDTKLYLEKGNVTNVYGGSNNNGTVDNTNVFAGYLNSEKAKSEPVIGEDDNPGDTDEGNAGGGNNNPSVEIPDYLPDLDDCENRDITYAYSYLNNYFNFSITNNTDHQFTSWTAKIKFENVAEASTNNWSGHKNDWEGTTTLNVYHWGQWYEPDITRIDAKSTKVLFENNYYLLINGSFPKITEVIITAYDDAGNMYTNTVCHDVKEPDPEPEPEPEEPEPEPEPDEPEPEPSEEKVVVTNLFGGNNIGGLSKSTHVYVKNAEIENVYGGGNLVATDETYVELLTGSKILENVYGGGNEAVVNQSTLVVLNGTHVLGSAYAGGNGLQATVIGDTEIVSAGDTVIDNSLFGGGNAAETGLSSSNDSIAKVSITGGTIGKNVYGGANTSKIYGYTEMNIGPEYEDYPKGIILIKGTVFGGGEANASGSENYDYSYISVTKGIDMLIDGEDADITINGSIFGSGNASSTSGYSNIKLYNFGTRDVPKKIVSVQRASDLLLYDSAINISGATDRTNEFNSIIYSLSRIDKLNLANDSTLYVQSGTNVVKEFNSYYIDEDDEKHLAVVDISEDGIDYNVDNRLYMVVNKAFNIIDSENLSTGTFGKVNGMTFFGLYEADRDGLPSTGIYDTKYSDGDEATTNDIFQFMSGSYVMGLHKTDHDIEKDGFYTNVVKEDTNIIQTKYIEPTPEDAKYYQWVVGSAARTFDISLTASKFATMGTAELPLLGFETANSYFELMSYNDNNLESGVELINPSDIPRVAQKNSDAMKIFGLDMSSSNANWLTDGKTYFVSTEEESKMVGTTRYNTNNTNEIPVLDFIFAHSKNITEDKKLGSVTIGLYAYVPLDEVTYKIERIYINVNMDTKYYETNNYESSMTPGKEYELFVNSKTDITSKSSLSAYFSLFVEKNKSIYEDGFHRVLISSFELPQNTRITMIDRTVEDKPVYYYYVVDDVKKESEFVSNKDGIETEFFIYPLSNFVLMGSTSGANNYSDSEANSKYYHSDLGISEEEFIFIVDYSEVDISEDVNEAELLLELKDSDECTHYDSLGVSHSNMAYNIFADADSSIDITMNADRENAYHGYEFNIDATLDFSERVVDMVTIKDTNYIQDKMGLKLSLYNSAGDKVNGTTLFGTIFTINGKKYYADIDGSVRANIADLVSDVKVNINVNLEKSVIPTDQYTIVLESFGSPDGLYYGLTSSGEQSIVMNIINENYGLNSIVDDDSIIIDKDTGKNIVESNEITYDVLYSSQFNDPNIRVKLYRRKYDETYSMKYEEVDLQEYVTDELISKNTNEYLVTNTPMETNQFVIHLKDKLKTGTYKMTFELYNENSYIGEVYSYMIIR